MNAKRTAIREELEMLCAQDASARAFILWQEQNARQTWISNVVTNIIFLIIGWLMGQISLPFITTHLATLLH